MAPRPSVHSPTMIERPSPDRASTSPAVLCGLVAVVVGCWILGNPRSSGPDEASHMVAASALVRGDRNGFTDPANPGFELFELPGMVGVPDPALLGAHVRRARLVRRRPAVDRRAAHGHHVPELPTVGVPAPRLGLVRAHGARLRVPRAGPQRDRARRAGVGCADLARSPPARWPPLPASPRSRRSHGSRSASSTRVRSRSPAGSRCGPRCSTATCTTRWSGTLAVGGWAAVLLARRDGPVWAVLVVLACCWLLARRPSDVWRDLGPRARWVAIAVASLPPLTPLGQRRARLQPPVVVRAARAGRRRGAGAMGRADADGAGASGARRLLGRRCGARHGALHHLAPRRFPRRDAAAGRRQHRRPPPATGRHPRMAEHARAAPGGVPVLGGRSAV